ncbi:AAA family ATPase [Methanococcoides alaskense]|uniref:AAA15 family ATPase/GTPase n=1 Tax=Methanococcoides alaskense TaxID=325778 RepID=A0AA90Z6F1_9EURY|nr:ATP-binding protein [Methanococcoides alaskense]MDA0525421.1 ATP-binding protein [Methanococcoides alaskense]MDR6221646.1 AAA15 family ATPase/GTPase [Methanococcoides alaskense]
MLIEFKAENFRSIRDEITFSLLASSDKALDGNLIELDILKKDDRLLRSSVIYGANASGKTNVLAAMYNLQALVVNSVRNQIGDVLPYSPFKLATEYGAKPTKFTVFFVKNNVRYKYRVSFDSEKIIDEFLYYYPNNREALVFERTDTTEFRFTTDKRVQNDISKRTLDNVLYLSNSAQQNYGKTLEAFKWFKENLHIVGSMPVVQDYSTIEMLKNDSSKRDIIKALERADLGLVDVDAEIKLFKPNDAPQEVVDKLPRSFDMDNGELQRIEINSYHLGTDESGNKQKVWFNFETEESEGTKRMFSLIGPWLDALENGHVLLIDELELKLHPMLSEHLIKLFHDKNYNKNNAQLIITTHNTNLLNDEIFRRDQIWFTEKDADSGSTDLYSLVEFKPRKDQNLLKGYLMGRYGALPFISS